MADDGIYHGRLECDGLGNLLATDDELKPVAYHDGSFIYLKPGEPSHNERHESGSVLEMQGTVDESMTSDPSLVNADSTENPHHFEVQPDDPHYDDSKPNKTKLKFDADSVAAKITGHTDAWVGDTA